MTITYVNLFRILVRFCWSRVIRLLRCNELTVEYFSSHTVPFLIYGNTLYTALFLLKRKPVEIVPERTLQLYQNTKAYNFQGKSSSHDTLRDEKRSNNDFRKAWWYGLVWLWSVRSSTSFPGCLISLPPGDERPWEAKIQRMSLPFTYSRDVSRWKRLQEDLHT